MKRLSGFSLMEMMTVLLIVSIVAAASAPMISKKMSVAPAGEGGSGSCAWQAVADGIAYNAGGDSSKAVLVGTSTMPENIQSRLHLAAKDTPFISLEDRNFPDNPETQLLIRYKDRGLALTNLTGDSTDDKLGSYATAIGYNATASDAGSIALGSYAKSSNLGSIAIGDYAKASSHNSIALGDYAISSNTYSLAIGEGANASAVNSTALGYGANASAESSIAIGANAKIDDKDYENSIIIGKNAYTQNKNSIVIGPASSSWIPGSNSITLGIAASTMGERAIAIGSCEYVGTIEDKDLTAPASATGTDSLAIGTGAQANGKNTVAIGHSSIVSADNGVAIGYRAKAAENQITLGTVDSTVYIPGNLIVEGNTLLGASNEALTYIREGGVGDKKYADRDIHLMGRSYGDVDREGSGSIRAMNMKRQETVTIGGYTYPSDRRLKNVGKAFTAGLAELKKLDLFHYTYKKDESKTPHVGVMAQDLQKVFPDAVTKGEDGFLRIRMEDMFYALVNAVKELASMFDRQDEKIVQLEKENKQLQKTVADLEKQNSEILKRLAKLEKQK